MSIRLRRTIAPIARLLAPGYTCCLHCGIPWAYVQGHVINFAPGRGIILVCTGCWPQVTHTQLREYASTALNGTGRGWRWNQPWDYDAACAVMRAVERLTPDAE